MLLNRFFFRQLWRIQLEMYIIKIVNNSQDKPSFFSMDPRESSHTHGKTAHSNEKKARTRGKKTHISGKRSLHKGEEVMHPGFELWAARWEPMLLTTLLMSWALKATQLIARECGTCCTCIVTCLLCRAFRFQIMMHITNSVKKHFIYLFLQWNVLRENFFSWQEPIAPCKVQRDPTSKAQT